MNTWVAIVAIVAIVMCAEVCKHFAKARGARRTSDDEVEQMLAKIELLEDRIRVLERIVTEKNYDLKQEINRL